MKQPFGLRMICVDDEQSSLLNCKAAVEGNPDVASATFFLSPTEALNYVESTPIDIAFLDIDMPEMDGFELAKKLQTLNSTIKIAFITGNIQYMRFTNRPIKAPFIFKPYADYDITDILEQVKCGA